MRAKNQKSIWEKNKKSIWARIHCSIKHQSIKCKINSEIQTYDWMRLTSQLQQKEFQRREEQQLLHKMRSSKSNFEKIGIIQNKYDEWPIKTVNFKTSVQMQTTHCMMLNIATSANHNRRSEKSACFASTIKLKLKSISRKKCALTSLLAFCRLWKLRVHTQVYPQQ